MSWISSTAWRWLLSIFCIASKFCLSWSSFYFYKSLYRFSRSLISKSFCLSISIYCLLNRFLHSLSFISTFFFVRARSYLSYFYLYCQSTISFLLTSTMSASSGSTIFERGSLVLPPLFFLSLKGFWMPSSRLTTAFVVLSLRLKSCSWMSKINRVPSWPAVNSFRLSGDIIMCETGP